MSSRRIFGFALALTLAVVLSAIAVAGASTKFSYTAEVTESGSAVVRFEEGSLKRFETVDYRLDATEVATWVSPCGGASLEQSFPSATITLLPDANGRASGTLMLPLSPPPPVTCPVLQRVEYTSVTLTDLTTGHVYRLGSISRDFS